MFALCLLEHLGWVCVSENLNQCLTTTPSPDLTQPQSHLSEEAAEKREAAQTAEDLNQDVVGGRIPRTLLKLLTYCRVSDKGTCEVLLELGKVKVNGEMCDDPVKLVRTQAFWIEGIDFLGGRFGGKGRV